MSAPYRPPEEDVPSEVGPAPRPVQPQLNQIPGKMSQAISAGLVNIGFSKMGSAMGQIYGDPSLAQPYQEMGNRIIGVMQERWFKKELENFETLYVQNYSEQAQEYGARLTEQLTQLDRGEIVNEDGSISKVNPQDESTIRMRDSILRENILAISRLDDDLMKNSAKYPGNPFIAERMQSLVQSRAQLIGQLTGPTPAQASEKGYADIEVQREKASHLRRQPFPDTSGAGADKTRGDPTKLLEEIGPVRFMAHLTGTPDGQKWLAPYLDNEFAKAEQDLMNSNETYRVDADLRKAALGAMTEKLTQQAAAKYMESVFPGRPEVSALQRSSQFGHWFPQAPAEGEEGEVPGQEPQVFVPRKLNVKEKRRTVEAAQSAALQQLDVIANRPDIETIDDALTELNRWAIRRLETYDPDVEGLDDLARNIRKEVMEWIRHEENWSESETARQRFGAKTFGEAAGEAIGGVGEAVGGAYRKGVLKARKGLLE